MRARVGDLARVRPLRDDWEGTLYSLTWDKVIPVT